jgi:hypothetical protein
MKKVLLLIFLISIWVIPITASFGAELPKVAVWDLASGDLKAGYAQDLTLVLVSEIAKLKKYEVYSQENVRTLAGWTEERMKLGCTSTQCLTALGQMDIAKLISGRIGKVGKRYSVSLNLFDTQNAKAENAVSEFGSSEDELIDLVQVAARRLLGAEIVPPKAEEKVPEKGPKGAANAFSRIPLDNALLMGDREAPLKVAVFTDPDCPFCATFHREMGKVLLERNDVAFYIFMFPLAMHQDAYWKSKSIVCNRSLKMLEDAFAKKEIPRTECDTKEIDNNIKLAQDIGIQGTPAIVFADGRVHLGTMSAKEFLDLLQEKR